VVTSSLDQKGKVRSLKIYNSQLAGPPAAAPEICPGGSKTSATREFGGEKKPQGVWPQSSFVELCGVFISIASKESKRLVLINTVKLTERAAFEPRNDTAAHMWRDEWKVRKCGHRHQKVNRPWRLITNNVLFAELEGLRNWRCYIKEARRPK